ncbi:MAG: carbon starvation protein A [Bacteroidales bacterium]|nr:carbon starvation protein A [Bacteroidales bacterium]
MISFILALLALVAGYFFYGRFVERIFGADDRPTPAVSKADGVDFMVLPSWKIFMIQFLNIAGTGPIFGAIMGAKFGPAAYLWIVFGCIFAGAVHDYLSGMLSVRHGGANLPDLIGSYLGKTTKTVMLIFSVLMLMMVGAVFVFSPAKILGGMWEPSFAVAHLGKYGFWIAVVFIYYIIATMLPIDKIIGRIYPLFAFALIFMAISLMVVLFVKFPDIPEVWEGLKDTPGGALTKNPIFPCLFISIACGAISGFHATQSPLMARCMDHEKKGRPIFYGAMITEGAVALIWATVASYFFYGKPEPAFQLIPGGAEAIGDAPSIVNLVCNEWLGVFGGILALLGVVAAPITSGDTALRSARLIIADFLNLEQRSIRKRLYICLPLFAAVFALLMWQMNDASGFEKLWGWFGWSNQTLSVFTLWTLTVYLAIEKKPYVITLVPALFMTWVCTTFFVFSPNSLGLNLYLSYGIGFAAVLVAIIWFSVWHRRRFQRA